MRIKKSKTQAKGRSEKPASLIYPRSSRLSPRRRELSLIRNEKAQEKRINLSNIVNFRLDSTHNFLKHSWKAQEVPVMVSVSAKDVKLESQRLGIDLVVVVDTTFSIGQREFPIIREMLKHIVGQLGAQDRLSLIDTNKKAKIHSALTPMIPEAKKIFHKIIEEKIEMGDFSAFEEGLKVSFESLLKRTEVNDLTSIFCLTNSIGLDEKIENYELITKDFDSKMKSAGMRYNINTFAFECDFPSKIYPFLSDFTGGNYYKLKENVPLNECFVNCLKSLTSVFATNAEVTLTIDKKINAKSKFRSSLDLKPMHNEATFKIGNLMVGTEDSFVCVLEAPPTSDLAKIELCQGTLSFVVNNITYTKKFDLTLQVAQDKNLGSSNEKVEISLLREQVIETVNRAISENQKKEFLTVYEPLFELRSFLYTRGPKETELAKKEEDYLLYYLFNKYKVFHEKLQLIINQDKWFNQKTVRELNFVQRSIENAFDN